MNVSLCMMVSNKYFKHIRCAIQSVCQFLNPDEILLGVAPSVKKLEQKIIDLVPSNIKVRVFEGTNERHKVAKFKFNLYDNASGDWIVNLDDDDGIIGSVNLEEIPKDRGFFHTDILGVCSEKIQFREPGDVFFRFSQEIKAKYGANRFMGSFYGYRKKAWEDVKKVVDREYLYYEEWRVVCHMIGRGWKDWYIPKVVQFQRVRDYTAIIEEIHKKGVSWKSVFADLENEVDSEKRYWENWNTFADNLEAFWGQPSQRSRRLDLYGVLRGVDVSEKRVLDFPCGTGQDYAFFRDNGWEYKGADVTQEMLDKFKEKSSEVDVTIDDVFNSKFEDNSFPLVLANALLLHLPIEKVSTAVRELWRITKEVLVIRSPTVDVYPVSKSVFRDGFIANYFTMRELLSIFDNLTPKPVVRCVGTQDKNTKVFVMRKN